jgi:hypothetical protein
MGCGETADGRKFSIKGVHPYAKTAMPHAHEVFFHVVADANHVRLPASAVLEVEGIKYWSTEFLPGRESLVDPVIQRWDSTKLALIESTFVQSEIERRNYLRGMLLDLALLNSDRPAWNLLGQQVGHLLEITFFDHDRTLGWRASDVLTDTLVGTVAQEAARFDGYRGCQEINHLAFKYSSKEECLAVFRGLDLSDNLLDEARAQIPLEWLKPSDFPARQAAVSTWVKHLQENFEKVYYPRITGP